MGMSKERKVFFGLFCVAIGGLGVDRFVLSPSSASAADGGAAAATGSDPLSGVTQSVTDGLRNSVQGVLRDALSSKIDESMRDQASALEFGPASAWLTQAVSDGGGANGAAVPSARIDSSDTISQGRVLPTPGLTMVMPTASGGIAMIDNVRLRVGQSHPSGFKLVAIGDRTATIEVDGKRTVLSMPMPR